MKAIGDEKEIDAAVFVKRMDNQVKEWDYPTLDSYILDCVNGLTTDQLQHVAWFLSVRAEHQKREKEAKPTFKRSRVVAENWGITAEEKEQDDHYFSMKD